MIFIIESGSTKSDWVLIDGKSNQSFFSTIGFNPYFHTAEIIESEIKENLDLVAVADSIKSIYFYGAGCSSVELNKIVHAGLSRVFHSAEIIVEHDLTACAYSTYQGSPAISCIIGTGSNSCYFDGETVSEVVPALGYILGDEGSGSYFGKKLLSSYLYHKLPSHIAEDFEKTFHLSKDNIVENVYKKPNANVYIASFMPFIAKHREENFFKVMVEEGMRNFMEVHVCCYPNYKEVPVHFVGSIAQIFDREVEKAANSLGIKIGQIIQKPIQGLVSYHQNYILNKQLN